MNKCPTGGPPGVSLVISHRLKELGLEERDLAAARVADSYVSQLLARKKTPPAPGRTEIYEKIGALLRLPTGERRRLARLQRREVLQYVAVYLGEYLQCGEESFGRARSVRNKKRVGSWVGCFEVALANVSRK